MIGGKFKLAVISACVVALPASKPAYAAFGYCSPPLAPTLYARKPSKPYCAINRSCSQWDVDNYKRDVDRYFSSLKEYLSKVDDFQEEAYVYAKCMAELD